MTAPILETRDLSVGYRHRRRETVIAADLNLWLRRGELVCVAGQNGVGKSTLLRTLAGMQAPLRGAALLEGEDVHQLQPAQRARKISVTLTTQADGGMLSGYALVALGRHPYTGWSGALSENDERIVRESVALVGAQDVAHRPVAELSDGERQKILIARALAQDPTLMILDEPTVYLDLPRRIEILQLLRGLAREANIAILLSIHDLDLALRWADRLWLMRENGALHAGSPEDLILSGAFEQTFSVDGVIFNAAEGSFDSSRPAIGEAHLIATGVQAIWTRRALARVGIKAIEEGAPREPVVWVEDRADGPAWRLTSDGETETFESLYDLIETLQTVFVESPRTSGT